jgi:hypothetical protein
MCKRTYFDDDDEVVVVIASKSAFYLEIHYRHSAKPNFVLPRHKARQASWYFGGYKRVIPQYMVVKVPNLNSICRKDPANPDLLWFLIVRIL